MGIYLYIALASLEGSPRRMFLCYKVNNMHILTLHVNDPIYVGSIYKHVVGLFLNMMTATLNDMLYKVRYLL